MGYSKRSQELAFNLSVKVSNSMVHRFGYTVWCDVATHRMEYTRPAVPVDNWNSPEYQRTLPISKRVPVPARKQSTPKRYPAWTLVVSLLVFLAGVALLAIPH